MAACDTWKGRNTAIAQINSGALHSPPSAPMGPIMIQSKGAGIMFVPTVYFLRKMFAVPLLSVIQCETYCLPPTDSCEFNNDVYQGNALTVPAVCPSIYGLLMSPRDNISSNFNSSRCWRQGHQFHHHCKPCGTCQSI